MSTFNIDDSARALIPTGFDAKLCNTYISGANIVIETIAQYLVRVPELIRSPGIPVTMLLPKEGYSEGSFPIETYKDIIINYNIKYYTFIGGVQDINFVEIPSGGSLISEQSFEFCIDAGVVETFIIDIYSINACTIDRAILISDGLIDSVSIEIGGVPVTGLDDMDITTAVQIFTSTDLNSVIVGDNITLTISDSTSGTPTVIRGKITFV